MTALDDIKSGIDLDQVAGLLGTDRDTADGAVDDALSSLLGAMGDNVGSDEDAFGLARAALADHSNDLWAGDSVDLEAVDAGDGDAILSHVYSPDQIQALSSSPSGGLVRKLLPILAPIVMAYLARRLQGSLGGRSGGSAGGGDLLGSILGQVLGGATGGSRSSGGGDDVLGSILGQVLGGGSQQSSQGGDVLGSILDQVLGGGSDEAASEPPVRTQAPRTRPADGGFRPAPSGDGGLRMDPGEPDVAASGPASVTTGGGLGDLLRPILVGR